MKESEESDNNLFNCLVKEKNKLLFIYEITILSLYYFLIRHIGHYAKIKKEELKSFH